MTNTSIYVLEGITPKYNYDETDFVKDDFGNIICSVERIGVYDDVNKAETDLTELIQLNERLNWKYGSKSKYFCFTLDELYLNNAIYGAGNISTFESRRSYLNGRNEIVKNGEKKTKNLFHAILIFRGSLLHWLAYLIRLASTANRPSVV